MIYVFDTNAFIVLVEYYYETQFPSLWERFYEYEAVGTITSTREVRRELEKRIETTGLWAKNHSDLFPVPTREEALFVNVIFSIPHFQQIIERRKQIRGGEVADPFVIARAKVMEGIVVTLEKGSPGGAKIPDICTHFNVPCMDLEGFMQLEKWLF